MSVALFVSGPFVMDPTGTPTTELTIHGIVHGIFGAIFFSLAPVTCFVFWRRFRRDERWRFLHGWTFAAGIVTAIAVVLLRIATPGPVAPSTMLTDWIGVIQRTEVIVFLAWVFAFAAALYRRVS
jgi:hypothetical protein